MNANELADLLEVDSWYKLVTREEIAAMLRQQQAEIEALKWEVNHREQDVDALKTKLNDVKYKYDIKIHQHVYTQVYVDELQAEIAALKMGFADSGTSDSELAEVRAFANRQILKNKELQAEVERLQQEYAKVFENHWSEQQ